MPRLYLTLSSSPGLKKTVANFLALLTDDKKLVSKRAPHPPLRYRGTPVFRIDKGFVAQTGDVTRQDGSGGESICAWAFYCSCQKRADRLSSRWRRVQR